MTSEVRNKVSGGTSESVRVDEGGVLHVVSHGASLASDVQTVLHADDSYHVDLFMCCKVTMTL